MAKKWFFLLEIPKIVWNSCLYVICHMIFVRSWLVVLTYYFVGIPCLLFTLENPEVIKFERKTFRNYLIIRFVVHLNSKYYCLKILHFKFIKRITNTLLHNFRKKYFSSNTVILTEAFLSLFLSHVARNWDSSVYPG